MPCLICNAGNPLVGDFEGALLIKKCRPAGPYDEEGERPLDKAEKHLADAGYKGKDPLEWMSKNTGRKKEKNSIGPARLLVKLVVAGNVGTVLF